MVRRASSCKVVRAFLSDWSDLSDRSDKSRLPGKRTAAAGFAAARHVHKVHQVHKVHLAKCFVTRLAPSAFDRAPQLYLRRNDRAKPFFLKYPQKYLMQDIEKIKNCAIFFKMQSCNGRILRLFSASDNKRKVM